MQAPLQLLAIVLTILLGTGGVTLLILLGCRLAPRVAVAVAASLTQIGEFSFILTGLAVGTGILLPEQRDLVLAAAIITIIANPLLFRATQELAARLERSPRLRRWHHGPVETHARTSMPRLSDHVIIVGHGRVGSVVAATLREQDIPYIVVEQIWPSPAQSGRRVYR